MAFTNFNFSHLLPGDVIIDILSRLPTSSLLNFRCVCKSWKALTRDLAFGLKRLSMVTSSSVSSSSSKAEEEDNTYLILAHDWHSGHAQLSVVHNNKTSPPVRSPFRSNQNLGSVILYGPCNGIICLYDYQAAGFALWNPATEETKVVPSSIGHGHPCDLFNMYPTRVKAGFGYDPATDDYKLFVITQAFVTHDSSASVLKKKYVGISIVLDNSSQQELFAQRVKMYSLNRNEWKFLETNKKINMDPPSSSPGHCYAYLNGFCYWLGSKKKLGKDDVYSYSSITSFDMSTESFREIGEVRHMKRRCDYFQLLVAREHLCLIWQEPGLVNLLVRVDKRWMKLHKVITLAFENEFHLCEKNTRLYDVLVVRDNGGIVLRSYDNRLKLYNRFTRELTDLVFDVSGNIDELVYCKGSLVPLNGRSATLLGNSPRGMSS